MAALLTSAARGQQSYQSIEELWSGVDPTKEALEIETRRDWTEQEFKFQELHFTGEVFEGQKVRVYAIQGAPAAGKRLPGILHIHGGGQTASLDWVRFWAKRGYVCVSFDYCGDPSNFSPRKDFTRWGTLEFNMAKVNGNLMKPDARHNANFHWTLIARRALTLLEHHPQIDPSRMGIFGISVGGSLVWLVAGTDRRVMAAVPIYGCGWNSYVRPEQTDADPVDEDTRLVRKLVSPEAYAGLIQCPLLFMDATNDHHGLMDRSFDTMARVPNRTEKRQVFTPQYIHHIEPTEGKDLPLWMEHCLKSEGRRWPKTPTITLNGGQDEPIIELHADGAHEVTRAQVFYALNDPWPQSRFWRTPRTVKQGLGHYEARAPFTAAQDQIFAFANVTYASGVTLTSELLSSPAGALPGTKPTLRWQALIDEMHDDADWRYSAAYTDPSIDSRLFAPWHGPAGESGFTLNAAMWGGADINFDFGTHKIGDPQWRGRDREVLLLDYDATQSLRNLRVKVTEREWQPSGHDYSMPVETVHITTTTSSPQWRTIEISPGNLKDSQGVRLPSWREANLLSLSGVANNNQPPVFRNLRWRE